MKLIFVLILSVYIISCVSVYTDFTLFKVKPFITADVNLKLNGIYYARYPNMERDYLNLMYLYSDGSIFYTYGTTEKKFWEDPDHYIQWFQNKLDTMSSYKNHYFMEQWGHFIVRNDSIYIQRFIFNDQYWMKRNSEDFIGIITSDSTIVIHTQKCSWCSSQYPSKWKNRTEIKYEDPIEYGFYQTSFKPDSTMAWFKNKEWYQEGLRERNNNDN